MKWSLTAARQSGAAAGTAAFSSVFVLSELFTQNCSIRFRFFSILLGTRDIKYL